MVRLMPAMLIIHEDDAIISSSWFESLGMNVDLALVDNSHTGPSETILSMNGDS